MAAVVEDMRCQNPGGAGMLAHFHHQLVGRRAVMVAARVAFVRNHDFADECFDLVGDGPRPIRYAFARRHSDSLRYLSFFSVNPTLT